MILNPVLFLSSGRALAVLSLKKIKLKIDFLSEEDIARLREWLSEKDPRDRNEEIERNPTSDGPDFQAKEAGGGKKRKRGSKKRD